MTRLPLSPLLKKSLHYVLALCFVGVNSSLMAQQFMYAKAMNNSLPEGGTVLSRNIQVDNLGNTYVTGYFTATADFDPGSGTADLISKGGNDIFFAKYDASGNYVYAKALGGTGNDMGQDIAVDAAGNVYLTGHFSATTDFDPGAGEANLSSVGNTDIFFAGYDASGNYLYAKGMGGTSSESGYGIAADPTGNVYITGSFLGTVDFDPGAGNVSLASSGLDDIFIAKYDAFGNYVYAKNRNGRLDAGYGIAVDGSGNAYITGIISQATLSVPISDIFVAKYDGTGNNVYTMIMGGQDNDAGTAIAVDASGNLFITGYFVGSVDFNPAGGAAILTSNGFDDIFIASYDASGNYRYAVSMGSTAADRGYGIAVDGSGNVYVTGLFIGTVDFDPGAGTTNLTTVWPGDIFVARYDSNGDFMYAKAMGGSGSEGNGIVADVSGNAYVTGNFSNTGDFDPGAGEALLTIGGSGRNAFISRLDDEGNYLLASQLRRYPNTALSDEGRSIVVDASGNTYVTGFFSGTLDFDPGPSVAELTSAGGTDIFLARYDDDGNYLYGKVMGGTGNDVAHSIGIDAAGNVYLSGSFEGTADFDPGSGIISLSSAGSDDIFIARYDPLGNCLYAKAIGGSGSDVSYGIAVNREGIVSITGFFNAVVDFDPGAGMVNLSSNGLADIFVARYDALGNYVYAINIGGPNDETSYGIAVDSGGNALITGAFIGPVDFDPGPGIANLERTGGSDAFVARYDASGKYVYAKSMGNTSPRPDYGFAIAVDRSGNAYVTGSLGGASGTIAVSEIFIAKYDLFGNQVYGRVMENRISLAQGSAIAVDASGNIYITGTFWGALDFDPGSGSAILGSALGSNDLFIAKYDASGNYVYAKIIGAAGGDYGYGITVDGSGNIYLTGSFSQMVNFDPDGASANSVITAVNSRDVFIAKYGPSGSLPIDLISFSARVTNNGAAVQLSWSTASETNNAFFEVERSKDGVRFEAIGRTPGCSTCTGIRYYEFSDNDPFSGVSYYRLKQVDHDAKLSYSPTERVSIETGSNTLVQVYPNMTQGAFQLKINNSTMKKQVVIQLLNTAGSLLNQQTVWLNEGDNRFNYNLSGHAPGVYYIRVADNNGEVTAARVLRK